MQTKSRLRTEILAALFLALAALAHAQAPAFDVASIKLHKDGPRVAPDFSNGRFTFSGPVQWLISMAYQLPINSSPLLSGGPDWIRRRNEMYDIDAKGSFPDGLSTSAREERERLMMQSLLADRFKLEIRREAKEMPVYVLVVDAGGPRLEKSTLTEGDCAQTQPDNQIPCHQFNGGQGRGLHARAATMDDLAAFVENWTERPLLNKTNIVGLWKIETQPFLSINAAANPPAPGAKAENGANLADLPTIFQVFEKLGLKMKPDKATLDAYIIDDIQRPTEN
jgi:uncharacterized protein (TIGR03435 family)